MKFLLLVLLCLPMMVFAQDAPVEGMEWVNSFVMFLGAIPAVGPYLAKFIQVMGILSASLTALAVFIEALLSIPEIAARIGNAQKLAEKIKEFKEKILPKIKYLSMFNVQKKK